MNWKLLAGRLYEAWRDYPAIRSAVASVPPARPIFLTGTHRSGATWLAKMLAESGIVDVRLSSRAGVAMGAIDWLRGVRTRIRYSSGGILLRAAAFLPSRGIIACGRRLLGIQMSAEEMLAVAVVVKNHRQARLLVFGTGKDSEFWSRVNRSGVTVFLEDYAEWVR